jgi:hypothetical protein
MSYEMALNRVVSELRLRPLLLVGSSRSGKTVMAKALVKRLLDSGVECITLFDPSLAWWDNSPLPKRVSLNHSIDEFDWRGCGCDISPVVGEERGEVIRGMIEKDYFERVEDRRVSGKPPAEYPLHVTVLEEAQTLFRKFGLPGTRIYDWVSMGLNFNMTGIYTTQRPAEVPTEIIERCNLLVGYVDGHRNKQKLRGATRREFMESVERIKQGSHDFMYYDGGAGLRVRTDNVYYGEPKTVRVPSAGSADIGEVAGKLRKHRFSWWWGIILLLAWAVALLISLKK